MLSPLAVLVPVLLLGAGSASAAASPGYTASFMTSGLSIYAAVAADPVTHVVYAADTTGKLVVIDGTTRQVQATLTLPGETRGIAVDPATNLVYATLDTPTPAVAVIDGATDTIAATIPLPAGSGPAGIAVDSATDTIYVADQLDNGAVDVVNGSTQALTETFSSGGGTPFSIAVNDSADMVWVANESGTVTAIDATDGSIVHSVTVTGRPVGIAVNPADDMVYVASDGGGAFTAIDGSAGTVTATLPAVDATDNVSVDPAANVIYASNSEDTYIVDGSTNTLVDTLGIGGFSSAVDTATGTLYVTPPYLGVWAITASATNAISPMLSSSVSTGRFLVGSSGSITFAGTWEPAPTFTETGPLPSGVTLSSSGTLSGAPAPGSAGVYPITVTADNGVDPAGSLAFTLTVDQYPQITVPATATAQSGEPVTIPVGVTGYPAPTVRALDLPAGMSLTQTASGGWQLSGTPAAGSEGTYTVTVSADNSVADTSQEIELLVTGPEMAVSALWGSQDRPYAQAPQLGSGWHSLGGTMLGAPAVAAVPNPGGANPVSPVFVAVGTNHKLYLRGVTGSWQLLGGKQPPSCLGSPAAVVTGKTLSVACEGTDHQLYYDAATLPGSGLPVFTAAFKNLGGSLTSTPAIAPAGGTAGQLIFFARGADNHLYTRTPSTGWVRRSWQCLSAPAAAQQASTRTTYLACEGTNKALYTGTVTTSGLTAPARQPGSVTTTPAIAATSFGVDVVLRGTGGVVTAGPLGSTTTPLTGLKATSVGAAALN